MEQVRHGQKNPMPRELSKGGQRPTVKLSVWSHGRQIARKKWNQYGCINNFEPHNVSELKRFFESNKEKYSEIWEIPLAYSQSSA